MQEPRIHARVNERPPSSPAYGGVVALTVIFSAATVLTYTLLPLPGQRALGAWNYAIAVSFLVATFVMVKLFRPAAFIEEDLSARPRVKQSERR